MKKEEYIKTLDVCGTKIDLGMDDYGQCYFIEWEENGEKKSTGLGTYNRWYMEDIYYLFDPVYKLLSKKNLYGEDMTMEEQNKLKEYHNLFDKEYNHVC